MLHDSDLVTHTIAILKADRPDAIDHLKALYAPKLVPGSWYQELPEAIIEEEEVPLLSPEEIRAFAIVGRSIFVYPRQLQAIVGETRYRVSLSTVEWLREEKVRTESPNVNEAGRQAGESINVHRSRTGLSTGSKGLPAVVDR